MADFLIDFSWERPVEKTAWRVEPAPKPQDGKPIISYPRIGSAELPARAQPGFSWGLAYLPLGIRPLPIGGRSAKDEVPLYLRHRGAKFELYRPLEIPTLYLQFAKLRTSVDLLAFVKKFGPLTPSGFQSSRGELVQGALAHADAMREFLFHANGAADQRAYLEDAQLNPFAEIEVTLAFDPANDTLAMRYKPGSLLDALWLQAVRKIMGGAVMRTCEYCGQLFEAGRDTKRRADATFCSEEHKVAFHSRKRSSRKETKR